MSLVSKGVPHEPTESVNHVPRPLKTEEEEKEDPLVVITGSCCRCCVCSVTGMSVAVVWRAIVVVSREKGISASIVLNAGPIGAATTKVARAAAATIASLYKRAMLSWVGRLGVERGKIESNGREMGLRRRICLLQEARRLEDQGTDDEGHGQGPVPCALYTCSRCLGIGTVCCGVWWVLSSVPPRPGLRSSGVQ